MCKLCPALKLKPVGSEPVIAGRKLKLIAIGESPGARELEQEKPFVGKSGQLFNRLLAKNRLLRSETHVMNGALCQAETDRDKKRAAACCAPRALVEIGALSPKVPILAMGGLAAKAVLGLSNIQLIRGFVWNVPAIDPKEVATARRSVFRHIVGTRRRHESELVASTLLGRSALGGRVVLPTVHPAFILRSETWGPVIKVDFKRAARIVRGEVNLKKLADQGSHLATTRVRELSRLGRVISLDVETDHAVSPLVARLLCVGMSDGPTTIILWPWHKRMARGLSRFLASRESVVCHNLNFDRTVLERHGVT
jgi:uracil-DNA glycosylase family 4